MQLTNVVYSLRVQKSVWYEMFLKTCMRSKRTKVIQVIKRFKGENFLPKSKDADKMAQDRKCDPCYYTSSGELLT